MPKKFLDADLHDGLYKGQTLGETIVGKNAVYESGPDKGKTVGEVAQEKVEAEVEKPPVASEK